MCRWPTTSFRPRTTCSTGSIHTWHWTRTLTRTALPAPARSRTGHGRPRGFLATLTRFLAARWNTLVGAPLATAAAPRASLEADVTAGGVPNASFALVEADLRAAPQGSAEGIVERTDPLRQGDDVDVIKEGENGLAVAELTLQVTERVVLR